MSIFKKIFLNIGDFFVFASGAEKEILELPDCRGDRTKFIGIGTAIFFTALFAFISSFFAIFTVFNNIISAIIIGLIWSSFIFALDRYIVSTLKKEISYKNSRFSYSLLGKSNELLKSTPRLIIAVIIAVTITVPLELKIFEREIKEEIKIMQDEKITEQQEARKKRLTHIEDRIKNRSNEVQRLNEEIIAARNRFDKLSDEAKKEADGTGGSKIRDMGPIFRRKQADADKAETDFQETEKRNNAIIKKLSEENETDNVIINNELTELSTSNNYDGMASRIEALNRLGEKNKHIQYAVFGIWVLFIFIELTPILFKIISDPTLYDYKLKSREIYVKTQDEKYLSRSTVRQQLEIALIEKAKEKYLKMADDEISKNPKKYIEMTQNQDYNHWRLQPDSVTTLNPISDKNTKNNNSSKTKSTDNDYIELKPVKIDSSIKNKKSHSYRKGKFAPVKVDISLRKDEKCYFFNFCNWYEVIPIKKRVTNEQKISRGKEKMQSSELSNYQIIENDWELIDSGVVYLTNSRLIFKSRTNEKNNWMLLKTILSYKELPEGVRIDKEKGRSIFIQFNKQSEKDVFFNILNTLK